MREGEPSKSEAARVLPVRQGPLVFAVVAVLALTLLGPWMTNSGQALTGEGSPLRQAAYLFILGLVVWAVRPLRHADRLLTVPIPILIALAWCWLSIGWSIAPGIAVRRLVLTTVIIWSIFTAVRHIGYERTVPLIRVALTLLLVVNFVTVIGWPWIGIHQFNEGYDRSLIGDWRGIMSQKNIAGAVCALTVLVFAFDTGRLPTWLRATVIVPAAFFVWMSGSKTSMGVCVGSIVVGLIFMFYNARYRWLLVTTTMTATLAIAATMNILTHPLTRSLSDRRAFTGRTQIWWALSEYANDNWMLGTGYGSFWNIGGDSPIYRYAKGWVVDLASGHNGFLDLLVTIGFPGLLIVVLATIIWPIIMIIKRPVISGSRGALIVSLFLFCVVHNVTESSLFDRDIVSQVFLMFALALMWSIMSQPSSQRAGRSFALARGRKMSFEAVAPRGRR